MPGSNQSPQKFKVADIKAKILRPALTSTYAAYFNVAGILSKEGATNFFNNRNANIDGTDLMLYCCEASLPGSSLATNEINNDYSGVTERHAYRRLYDDRADFTFYVDHDFKVVRFFETWISWIVGESQLKDQASPTYNYRVRFPNQYITDIHIQKFEKDYESNYNEYTFIGAYPISINSMPVSYDSSQLLKCTVSFTYKRYLLNTPKTIRLEQEPKPFFPNPQFGIPNLPVINDVNGNTFPLGTGIPGLTGVLNPTIA
jgi:hypothetical protein